MKTNYNAKEIEKKEALRVHNQYVHDKNAPIICTLLEGEHLKQIRGLEHFLTASDYKVAKEFAHHYLIEITVRTGLIPEWRNKAYTSISKASIYCGNAVLMKTDGSRVTAQDKRMAR